MPDPGADPLTPLADKVIHAGGYRHLVVGEKSPLAGALLENVTPDQLLAVPMTSPVSGYAMLGALWLWHDALEECHQIVQRSPEDLLDAALNLNPKTSPNVPPVQSGENDKGRDPRHLMESASTLAFWHAILHRREGDFSNAKYWYARCKNHPILTTMAPYANDVLHPLPADKSLLKLVRAGWDPNAFVDLVEQVHQRPADVRHAAAVALQKIEWRLLFDFCTRAAAGQ